LFQKQVSPAAHTNENNMIRYFALVLFTGVFNFCSLTAQQTVIKNIHGFGAKGDGKTNDTEAFIKAAAFFNGRGGNGTLIISKGVYIVGKQSFSNGDVSRPAYRGYSILDFKNVSNLTIKGEKGTVLKYAEALKFGSFDYNTGKIFNENNSAQSEEKYAANIGYCIGLSNCDHITVKLLALNGSNKTIQLGGRYGDKGIQLMHCGLYIKNSNNIFIDAVTASYFALDGMIVTNEPSPKPDNIHISNSAFEYNFRQGLSWVGGNYLQAINCKFNHTGKIAFCSPPGAGVDIEPEVGPVTNGNFENCEFIDNTGCGVVTSGGLINNCTFTGSTFWGTSSWSIWVSAPAFTFTGCNIYGSIVHGYNATNAEDATKFIRCAFEDKPFNGMPPYGKFLIECDGPRRILFDSCTFTSHKKELAWLNTSNATSEEEKATIRNSRFIIPKKEGNNTPVKFGFINFHNNKTEFKN
jgi:hypothetical protein